MIDQRLYQSLGLTVREEPTLHITWDDIRAKIGEKRYARFEAWMRGQTCIAEGAYPLDVERFLSRDKGA